MRYDMIAARSISGLTKTAAPNKYPCRIISRIVKARLTPCGIN